MQQTSIFAWCIISIAVILLPQVNALCDECNANGAACTGKTTYQLCNNGNRDNKTTYSCEEGFVCTTLMINKCLEEGAVSAPGCDVSPLACDKCTFDGKEHLFTCTSRTTFAQCSDRTVTGSCPEGMFCRASAGGDICVSECTARPFECDTLADDESVN